MGETRFEAKLGQEITGPLALRTAATLFSGVRDIHIVSYVPGDAATLEAYRCMGWQVAHRALRP